MVMWRLLLWLLLGSAGAAWAGEVTLHVEPDPPPANESFMLIFETTGSVDDEPDFAPLEQDFEILGRNQQQQLQIVNGHANRSTVWSLNVLPRHASPLVVPAIRFGSAHSEPRQIALATAAAGAGRNSEDDGVFLEAEVSPPTPYVQQEMLYTLRLWRRYELSNASLTEPAFSGDVVVKPLTEDRRYEKQRNGQRYEVVERRFLLYPQHSGPLTIKPATVTAQIIKRGFSLFENLTQAMATRRISSLGLEVKVKPVPAGFPGKHWLPARKLSLQEEWEPATRQTPAGTPLTRTLTLWADGLTAGQLPPFDTTPPAGWRAYPERPQTQDQTQGDGYHGTLAQKVALIPTSAGETELPAIDIPWWNTTTDQLEHARLPATVITALLAAEAPPPTPVPPPPVAAAPAAETAPGAPPPQPVATAAPLVAARDTTASWWPWLAALTTLGWGLTLLLWWLSPTRTAATPVLPPAPRGAGYAAPLDAACARDDLREIERLLLAWGAERWPASPPRTLETLARRVAPPFAAQLMALDAARHRGSSSGFDSAQLPALWQAEQRQASSGVKSAGDSLPQLYPRAAD